MKTVVRVCPWAVLACLWTSLAWSQVPAATVPTPAPAAAAAPTMAATPADPVALALSVAAPESPTAKADATAPAPGNYQAWTPGAVKVESTGMDRLRSAFGLFGLLLVGVLLSYKPRLIPWKLVIWGCTLQIIFGALVLLTDPGQWMFDQFDLAIKKLLEFFP